MFRQAVMVLALGPIFALGSAMPAVWAHGTTERISVSSGDVQGDRASFSVTQTLSADGRFVAFESIAGNLVPNDTNAEQDIFVRDRQTGTTRRVSVSSGGAQGNTFSRGATLSGDGRFVAFYSAASNLVSGDTNGVVDVFVHDRKAGTTQQMSLGPGGVQGNGDSYGPVISADGRFVAFESRASNLVPGDTNRTWDAFAHDRQTGTTRRVSVSSGGAQGNGGSGLLAISANGRFVAFQSSAGNLVPGDTNAGDDVFIHDQKTGTTRRVSVRTGGGQGNGMSAEPALSADGRFVAFTSAAGNLVPGDTNGGYEVFLHDQKTGTTRRVSVRTDGGQADGNSFYPALSADGRFVAFASDAGNLVPGDTNAGDDAFLHDRKSGTTRRVSVRTDGGQGNGSIFGIDYPVLSANGRFVAFASDASNLVPGDTNATFDVFVRTLAP